MAAYTKKIPPGILALQTGMYAIGATIVHSAACVINDIFDVDFDWQVGVYGHGDSLLPTHIPHQSVQRTGLYHPARYLFLRLGSYLLSCSEHALHYWP
jgi:hypothetical protein